MTSGCVPVQRFRQAFIAALAAAAAMAGGYDPVNQSVTERRAAVVAASEAGVQALPLLTRALEDENPLVRRVALRALVSLGEPALPVLKKSLTSGDYIVRRTALVLLYDPDAPESISMLARALKDDRQEVRRESVIRLVDIKPRTKEVTRLLEIAKRDPSAMVSDPAKKALWPFQRKVVLLRDRVADSASRISKALEFRLPAEDWRFKPDPKEVGHETGWFAPDLDEGDWSTIAIEQFWQKAGHKYTGVAWYRRNFALPAKPECAAAEILFGAVDEMAWIWINGRYVGSHDIGPAGWKDPFRLDVTNLVKWGAENQITVRVLNTAMAGGIWRPVTIEALKLN